MKQPEDIKQEFTRQWLEKAERDYKTSGHLLSVEGMYLEAVAFHAQQAAEKYLKALLVWNQAEFPKTHDINLLFTLLSNIEPGLAAILAEAAILTAYAVEYRYPGDYPDVRGRCKTLKDREKQTGRLRVNF
jgi:HEPN domain-containing protein